MNKQTKITTGILALSIIVIALIATIYFAGNVSQDNGIKLPSGAPPAGELKLTGDIPAENNLTITDLAKMPLMNATIEIDRENANYTGVTIATLLNHTALSWDTGSLTIIGVNNSRTTITTYKATNGIDHVGTEFLLAFAKNDEWLNSSTKGPLFFIALGYPAKDSVENVQEINFGPWTVTVDGEVTHQLTVTSENIADYGVKTVQAAFVPGGEPQRVSNWTGVTLSSLLKAAGVYSNATKVTVNAPDGYTKEFTLSQVESTGMMICYMENGSYLSPDGGQPYRLVIPTDEFKWGQYWVRWVASITVF